MEKKYITIKLTRKQAQNLNILLVQIYESSLVPKWANNIADVVTNKINDVLWKK